MSKSCKFCQYFSKSKLRENGKRFCREKQQFRGGDEGGCSEFSLGPYFYCEKEGIWQHVICCVKRQGKKFPDICRACSLGESIMDLCRGKDLYTHFNLRRSNLEKTKTTPSHESTTAQPVEINLRKRA
jgi:hypothetical protein